MSAEATEVIAATTEEAPPTPDGSAEAPKGAESAPAVKDADEAITQGVRSRIDELTRYRREAERERDYWRQEAERLRPAPKPPEPVEVKPKTLADFEYDEGKYQQYIFSELPQAIEKRAVEAAERRLQETQTRERAESRHAEFEERSDAFAKDHADFVEVALKQPQDGGPVITATMAETIEDSENGPAIAYHLGKNLRLAAEIARLSPLQQAREIGRIEAKLDKPVVPRVSTAPEPASRIEAFDSSTTPRPDTPEGEKLSDSAWLKAREKQVSRRK